MSLYLQGSSFLPLGIEDSKRDLGPACLLVWKKDELRVYQLENELMSNQPGKFEMLNDFFTKFKHIVLLLQQCELKKADDQLILSILSKLGANYSVFVSTFRVGKLTTPGWKMPTLNALQ